MRTTGVPFLENTTLLRAMIVVPCYNEGSRLQSQTILDFLRRVEGICLLFVNDGSRDNTISVLQSMRNACEDRIQILDQKENMGKAEAVRLGMLTAMKQRDTAYVGFWDADLSTPLDALPEFLAVLVGNRRLQMVFGSRVRLLGRHVHRHAIRHYLGRVFASCVSVALRLPIYDTQCGAKLFRVTPELVKSLKDPFLSRWVFDVEILARYIALDHGDTSYLHDSIYEFPLKYWSDVAGSKVRPGDFFRAFIDVFRIYLRYLSPSARSKTTQDLTPSPVGSTRFKIHRGGY
jgi:dolichyl-phosphate beta-glucosyltransferase